MAKTKLLQTNFSSGELSPLMLGRVDTTKYQNGAAQLSNFIVKPQGGAWFRQGSMYVSEVKDSTRKVRLQEFEFSDIQAYVIEFGDLYVRIYYNGGFVETSPGSGIPLEVVTPYTEADLPYLSFTQSADVLYIAHGSYQPKKLERLGANSWSLVEIVNEDGPYLGGQQVDATLTLSNYTSVSTVVASVATFTVPTSKQITAVSKPTGTGGKLRYTVASHGLSTGAIITVSGVEYTEFIDHHPVHFSANYPYGNGQYTITSINSNTLELNESIALSNTYVLSSSSIEQAISVTPFFEYRINNNWHLAQFLGITSTTTASVFVIQNIKADISKQGYDVHFSSGNVITSNSGAFTTDDLGMYVRAQTGAATGIWAWYLITGFISDTKVSVSAAPATLDAATWGYPTVTMTVSTPVTQATLTSSIALFASTDVGRHVRLNYGGKQPWCKIISYTSTTSVNVSVYGLIPVDAQSIQSFYNGGATDIWKFGAWSDTTGYPKVVTFHEQRLWFACSSTEPSTIWASRSSDYENFSPTEYDSSVLDSCAITYGIVSRKANPILWMTSGSILLIGTLGAEFRVSSASSVNAPITPTNITALKQTNNGSLPNCKVITAGNAVLFVQRAGRKMYELLYSFQEDSFVTKNLTVVNDHIFRQGGAVVQLAYQKEPNNLIWVLLTDGSLACLTYEKEQQVAAWHRHSLGGSGFVESFCIVPSSAGTEDSLYLVVKRTINGVTKRYIEYLLPDFYPTTVSDRSNMQFLDASLVYSGVSTSTVTGATHIANEVVSVVSDGVYIGELTVSNTGEVTLPIAATKVVIGYKYRGLLQMLPLDGGSHDGGTAMGKVKRSGRTLLRLVNSLEFKYGSSISQLDTCKMTTGNQISPSLDFFTGDKIVELSSGYDLRSTPYIVQDNPYPLVVLAVGPDTEVTQ